MTNSRMTDPEVLEWRFPVRLEEFSVRTNTGGAGRHKGGDGVTRKLRFLEPMTVNLITGHRINPTYALAGGQPGGLGKNWLERADASRQQLAGIDQVDIQINDMVVIQTPGGGGYGKPQTYQQHKNTAGE
jgi:5-oxoprolinase (ATP-hydrolysing)